MSADMSAESTDLRTIMLKRSQFVWSRMLSDPVPFDFDKLAALKMNKILS
jgi:hypothetical protein